MANNVSELDKACAKYLNQKLEFNLTHAQSLVNNNNQAATFNINLSKEYDLIKNHMMQDVQGYIKEAQESYGINLSTSLLLKHIREAIDNYVLTNAKDYAVLNNILLDSTAVNNSNWIFSIKPITDELALLRKAYQALIAKHIKAKIIPDQKVIVVYKNINEHLLEVKYSGLDMDLETIKPHDHLRIILGQNVNYDDQTIATLINNQPEIDTLMRTIEILKPYLC